MVLVSLSPIYPRWFNPVHILRDFTWWRYIGMRQFYVKFFPPGDMQTNAAAWWFWILKLFDKRWRGVRYGNFITFSSMASALELIESERGVHLNSSIPFYFYFTAAYNVAPQAVARTNIRSIFIYIHIPCFHATFNAISFLSEQWVDPFAQRISSRFVVRVSIFTCAKAKRTFLTVKR